jgi:hypothetical protein
VEVFSAGGQLIDRVADETMSAGPHSIVWRAAAGTPAGMYLYRVTTSTASDHGRVIRVSGS